MELHSVHKTFHHSHLGEEKHQMLNLNRRLETYLSRVKLLEEENALLAKEIQSLRRSSRGASTRRKGLEEELQQARLEVEAAWRDKVHTELEVGRLAEQLQALDLQRQREIQANVEANMKLERSRKELQEEQRAQMWLREKVGQLEHEMMHIIQTHQEDVAHLEATLTHSRATVPPRLAQRGNQLPNLLQLGEEFSQRASRAWQEAAEAYQGQLARLEESLNQARSRLSQVGQEKSESQLKLQTLEREIASAHDIRLHLEKTAAQQGHKHSQDIQQLQGHLGDLEAEKAELGQQIDRLLLENRRLLQLKTSLGLEVATYRALLDSESLRGDVSLLNQPRHISITDTVCSPHGVKKNYQTQLSATHKTTSLSSVRSVTGRGPTTATRTPTWSKKHASLSETPKLPHKDTTNPPYPKILQDGAVENFRPQEVHEKVTYAEPLSPPNEEEALTDPPSDKQGEEDSSKVECLEEVVESAVGLQVESDLSSEPPFSGEVSHHLLTTPDLTLNRMTQQTSGFSVEADEDESFEMPAEKENIQEPPAPVEAWVQKESKGKEVQHVREETSDSETEAVHEPNVGSRTSSPVSECETEESVLNAEFSRDDSILKEDVAEIRQEISSSVETNETDVEYKLYPDGEEMDTWDSVIERKVDVKVDEGIKKDEEKLQHAEPEEDISAREQEHKKSELTTDIQKVDYAAFSLMDAQVDDDGEQAALDEERASLPENEENDEEEDSQNVSVSWRTELEGDSYAQDNTLADTRPLIRYKSDETDANTQASHMDESESSEGEQDRKIGETGSGTWSEGKSKRFGTMEDLCEEVEGEGLDEEYNLEYVHNEDSVDPDMTGNESVTVEESVEEIIKEVSEVTSDEETEELIKPVVPTNVDDDEELDTDRLVEEELENLATDRYVAHFAQRQVSERKEMLHLQGESDEEMMEEEEAEITKTESSCEESDFEVNHEPEPVTVIIDQPDENLHFSDSAVLIPKADTSEDVHREDHEALDAPEKREEQDEHNVSMVTHADATEDHSGFSDFITRPDMAPDQEDLQEAALPTEEEEVVPCEASSISQEHLSEDVADCQKFPEGPETAEWEVRENLSEEIRDQDEDYEEKCGNEPAGRYLQDDGGSDEGATTQNENPLEISPDSLPDENDIFVVKDSTEVVHTNGKDTSPHGFFSSGVKSDFWVSSLQTGATNQPGDACNEAAEQTNQNIGFADSLVWGNLQNPNVVNNSGVDLFQSLSSKKEMHSEVKQVFCRDAAEGDLVHSEESEVDGEAWSSGEEAV